MRWRQCVLSCSLPTTAPHAPSHPFRTTAKTTMPASRQHPTAPRATGRRGVPIHDIKPPAPRSDRASESSSAPSRRATPPAAAASALVHTHNPYARGTYPEDVIELRGDARRYTPDGPRPEPKDFLANVCACSSFQQLQTEGQAALDAGVAYSGPEATIVVGQLAFTCDEACLAGVLATLVPDAVIVDVTMHQNARGDAASQPGGHRRKGSAFVRVNRAAAQALVDANASVYYERNVAWIGHGAVAQRQLAAWSALMRQTMNGTGTARPLHAMTIAWAKRQPAAPRHHQLRSPGGAGAPASLSYAPLAPPSPLQYAAPPPEYCAAEYATEQPHAAAAPRYVVG